MNEKWLRGVLIGACVMLLSVLGAFALRFSGQQFSESTSAWGEFGDYVGGLLNPMVALCALVLLAAGVRAQWDAMKIMRFDTQFTGLIQLLATVKQNTAGQAMRAEAAIYIRGALTPEAGKELTDKAVLSALGRSSAAWEGILGVIRSIAALIDSHGDPEERDRYYETIRGLVTNDEAIIYSSILELRTASREEHAALIERLDLIRYMNNPDRITIRNGFAEIRKRTERVDAQDQ